jgi:hypothetical protein
MSKLSELLERFRPAGAPGAPAEGERSQRRERRLSEIGEIVTVLHAFESEAAALVAAAEDHAATTLRDAEIEARKVRADLPQQLARAQAADALRGAHPGLAAGDAIAADAAVETERLQSVASERIAGLSAEAIESIWAAVLDAAPTERSQ